MTYRSKIDTWLLITLWTSLLVCPVIALILLFFAKDSLPGILVVLGCEVLISLLFATLVFPMKYTIGEGGLRVRSGLLNWRIPLDGIVEVKPTRNPLSAPALSVDRLNIRYRPSDRRNIKSVMISPDNRTGFLQELASLVPALQFEGDRLVRK